MCNRNFGFFAPPGVALSYLVPCFQLCYRGNIFKFLMKWRLWSLLCFPIFKFSISQYVFLIFKVYVTQSATWVIFTELILTSLSQILILIYLPRLLWFLEGWFQKATNQLDGTVQCLCGRSFFLCQTAKGSSRGAMLWLPKYYASSVGVPCCHCHMDGKLYKKHWGFKQQKKFQDKTSVRNTLPEKNGLNQTNKGKNLYARLWTVRVVLR